MSLDRWDLERKLRVASFNWEWGYKYEALRSIAFIIKSLEAPEPEGSNGEATDPSYSGEERKTGQTARQRLEARREELRRKFAEKFEAAGGESGSSAIWDGDPSHLF